MNTTPDRWSLVRVSDDLVKVMATWSGGYLHGDSWKLNSGINKVEDGGKSWLFTGFSGSVYECKKGSYGMNYLGAGVLDQLNLKPMSEKEAIKFITK